MLKVRLQQFFLLITLIPGVIFLYAHYRGRTLWELVETWMGITQDWCFPLYAKGRSILPDLERIGLEVEKCDGIVVEVKRPTRKMRYRVLFDSPIPHMISILFIDEIGTCILDLVYTTKEFDDFEHDLYALPEDKSS